MVASRFLLCRFQFAVDVGKKDTINAQYRRQFPTQQSDPSESAPGIYLLVADGIHRHAALSGAAQLVIIVPNMFGAFRQTGEVLQFLRDLPRLSFHLFQDLQPGLLVVLADSTIQREVAFGIDDQFFGEPLIKFALSITPWVTCS